MCVDGTKFVLLHAFTLIRPVYSVGSILLPVENVAKTPYYVDKDDAACEVEASLPSGPLDQYCKTIKHLY